MNSELLKKIQQSGLSAEDARDIVRIFPILTQKRQVDALEDFPSIAERIKASREKIEEEKRILWSQTLDTIIFDLEAYVKNSISGESQKALEAFQSEYQI